MLENVRVGQRSGVSPVWASLRSQKTAKVRCSSVSRNAWARGEPGSMPGGGLLTEQAIGASSPRINDHRADDLDIDRITPGRQDVRWGTGLVPHREGEG